MFVPMLRCFHSKLTYLVLYENNNRVDSRDVYKKIIYVENVLVSNFSLITNFIQLAFLSILRNFGNFLVIF